jgi:hypothetical protein
MTKKQAGDDAVVNAVHKLMTEWAREEGLTPEQLYANLMEKAHEENQRNPWRAERIGMLADMEERLGKAIPDILTLVDMHPEMSIEEFTAFVAGTLQPN